MFVFRIHKIIAAGSCCTQLLWMQNLLHDYGICQEHLTIYCDNTSITNISKNPIQHFRTKHIEIRHRFIKELVEDGTFTLEFIHTDDQKADLFTKPLDSKWFEFLRQNIGVISMDWSLSLLFSPHAFAFSFMLCLTCFCLFFSILFIFFHIKINKKIWKFEKYKNSVCYVYIGTYISWMAIETKFSKFYIVCSLDEYLYVQLSKWALWLVFVMSKIKLSLVLNTHITLFDGKD